MLFPYGMCHFSQVDFKILSFVLSSLTTMDLTVLFVSILLNMTSLLESVNLFLQKTFFLFYSLNPFFLRFQLHFCSSFFIWSHMSQSWHWLIFSLFLFFSRLDFFLLLYLQLPQLLLLSSPITVKSIQSVINFRYPIFFCSQISSFFLHFPPRFLICLFITIIIFTSYPRVWLQPLLCMLTPTFGSSLGRSFTTAL